MAAVTIIVEVVTVSMLYKTPIEEERARLEVTAKSQARLIKAIPDLMLNLVRITLNVLPSFTPTWIWTLNKMRFD